MANNKSVLDELGDMYLLYKFRWIILIGIIFFVILFFIITNDMNKELNLISWNERELKYDIKDWSENHEKMGKGITLTNEEAMKLRNILNNNLKCNV